MSDELIPLPEAARRCGLTAQQFHHRQEKKWPGVLGRRLLAVPLPGPPGRGGSPRHFFHAKDVDEVAAILRGGLAPGWIGEHTYRDDRGDWMTAEGAAERFELPARSVRRWGKRRCRFNGGKVIAHQRIQAPTPVRSRRGKGKVDVYLVVDLERVKLGRANNHEPTVHRSADGAEYITAAEMVNRFGVSRKLVWYWAAKPSRLRPGMALRSEEAVNTVAQAGLAEVPFYRVEDLERILRGEETVYPGTGRPRKCCRLAADAQRAVPPAPAAVPPGASPARPKGRRGRIPSPEVEAVLAFCYDRYMAGDELAVIRAQAERRFGAKLAPKEARHVSTYAERYARRTGKAYIPRSVANR